MARKSPTSPFRWVYVALLALGALGVCFLMGRGLLTREKLPEQRKAAGVYEADAPLPSMPEKLLPGYILLSVEDLLTVPEVDGFQWPCGSPNGAMTYDAQPFGTDNPEYGGHHAGADINGIGGQNTDLGMPVCASARGLVVYCGTPSPGWGKVVVLAHRIPGTDRIVQTLYAHLNDTNVRRGSVVARGEQIGTIGTADGRYLAHLHFEAIESRCTEAGVRGYHPDGTMNRLDPADLISSYPAPAVPDVYRAVRAQRIRAWNSAPPSFRDSTLPADVIPVNPSQYSQP